MVIRTLVESRIPLGTNMTQPTSRRKFLTTAAATAVGASAILKGADVIGSPAIVTSKRSKSKSRDTITGEGDYQYKVDHKWCQLPDMYTWQTTHNVAIDSANNLYVIHEGKRNLKDHPSIFVFDPTGKFIRAFGAQFQGGGHGIEIRKESDGHEYIYVAAYQQVKAFAKLTLKGETVWFKKAPMETGVYADGEATSTEPSWNRKGFLPTDFAFLDDGGFLLVDGYGSYYIHQFDKDAKWVKSFGGEGKGNGKFNLAHGIQIDRREGREECLMVTDRSHNTVQRLTLAGEHLETMTDFGKPANIDFYKNLMLIPELISRVSIFDENNKVVARLGTAIDRLDEIEKLREKPDQWLDGQFVHPHDACFDAEGNIFVAEWVSTGRVTKLTRV